MNVLLKVQQQSDAAKIAHSVTAYDRATNELELELPIPLFLDTLALKIARVPPEDEFGALSYALDGRALDVFRFLLGLEVDTSRREYFLESTAGHVTTFGLSKLSAVEVLAQGTPPLRYARTAEPRLSEGELVLPVLRLLDTGHEGWMATSDIVAGLGKMFPLSGEDGAMLGARSDTYFSRRVRSMISHRDQPSSFIRRGLADYERHGLQISTRGRSVVRALLS